MYLIKQLIEFFLHIDKNLILIANQYGSWIYGILTWVIFMETGLVFTPFLPGDSLLFAAGALAARGVFKIGLLFILLLVAVFLGDNCNYWIGRILGIKILEKIKFIKKEHLTKTEKFYEKYGPKAVILSRFVPIVRTFSPFVAGIGKMEYKRFLGFSITGALLWVSLFLWGGYFIGNVPIIKENFHYMVLGIVVVSLIPIGVEIIKAKREKKK
jgi:membrane-associated protein